MFRRFFIWLAIVVFGKEVNAMLVRLYAGEIILGKITMDRVPALLKGQVQKYLDDLGFEQPEQ